MKQLTKEELSKIKGGILRPEREVYTVEVKDNYPEDDDIMN